MCVYAGEGGVHHFYHVSRLSLHGHTGILGSGRSPLVWPTVQTRGVSVCCPSTRAICTLGRYLAYPGSGVVAPWSPLGQFLGISSTSPSSLCCPVLCLVLCVYWGFHSWWCSRQRGSLHGQLNLAISPERMPLTHGCHRPPPGMPNLGIDPTTFRLRDLR